MRRCILFAGHMIGDNIDEVDLYHVEKLSEIGDVYCCYDNVNLPEDGRCRLVNLGVKLAIALRHGEYDFGSWKRLFRAVGWDEIARYDEVILVNNSVILVGNLLEFLEKFESSDSEFFASALLNEHYPGPTVLVKDYMARNNPHYNNSMFPSVFWAMKKSLVAQNFVRNLFENVRPEADRLDVCYKYERGFSRKILRRNIKTTLFVDVVYPHSFLYTEVGFGLVGRGFPYIKRKSLTAKYYGVRVMDARVEGLCKRIPARAAEILRDAYDRMKCPDRAIDAEWYLKTNPDVAAAKMEAEAHFASSGREEGRAPNASQALYRPQQTARDEAPLNSVFELDEDWYLLRNADVAKAKMSAADHFKRSGSREMRDPNSKFSTRRYVRDRPELKARKIDVFGHFVANRDKKEEARQAEIASAYVQSKKLLIFFNVARDLIGGGMLSINRFATNAGAISPETGYDVAVSGVPVGNNAVWFSKFETTIHQVELRILAEMTDPEDVVIFLPEVFAVQFAEDLTEFELGWLMRRKTLKIVVLNQNNELMPPPQALQDAMFPLTLDVTISAGHSRYCTPRLASRYTMPVKQLTPYLPTMKMRNFAEKEKLFLLSADQIGSDPGGLSRDNVVKALKARLPDFEFVTIENMALDDYLDLASRAMFSITFGEGMDGYYIEPVLAGGISFAVYNSTFFPESFQDLVGVLPDWSTATTQVPDLVNSLMNGDAYDTTSKLIRDRLDEVYSASRSTGELRALIRGEVDLLPTAWADCRENFTTVKDHLVDIGYKFFEFGEYRVCALPDGSTIRHMGGEFYSVIYEVYIRKDYDLWLEPDQEYVLIDVGANVGLTSVYLLKKYNNIIKSYAFEPAEPTARIALENISGNGLSDRIELLQIGLSGSFSEKTLQFIPDWSTAFSTDNEILLPELRETSGELDPQPKFVDVEVAPAHSELAQIFDRHPGKAFILKCDTQGSEFALISSLAARGMLENVDSLIVETHFRSPDALIDTLNQNGFVVEVRSDSVANMVHTVWASRAAGRFPPHALN